MYEDLIHLHKYKYKYNTYVTCYQMYIFILEYYFTPTYPWSTCTLYSYKDLKTD